MIYRRMAAFFLTGVLSFAVNAAEVAKDTTPTAKVRYKHGKEVDFEALLIQGQLKRPELSVVTGDAAQGSDGLVRLRENFLDKVAEASGEESP